MAGQKHILLNSFFVDPSSQRKGAGATVLKAVIERAEDDHVPVFLQGSPVGHDLYKRMGWEDVEFLDVDLADWVPGAKGRYKGWGIYRYWFMFRKLQLE